MDVLVPAVMLFGAGLALAGLRRVPEDTVCTVHRFGRYVRTLTPGFRFTLPFVDQIAHRVRLMGHEIELPPQRVDAGAAARGAVYYQILDPERAGHALDDVDALVAREARSRFAALADARTDVQVLAAQLKTDLNQRLGTLGLRITRCRIDRDAA